MYAIIRTGGKQYRVEEGRSLDVELLPAKEGGSIELDNVLLIANDGEVTVGTPLIEGARVIADVESHGRQKKIVVFKYKSKVRTRKKTGHRQHFTRLAVTEILAPGQESKAAKPKRKARKPAKAKAAAAEVDAAVAVSEKAPTTEKATAPSAEKPAPKKRTRKPAAAKADATAAATEKATPKKRARKPAAAKAKADAPVAEADDKATAEKKPARKRAAKKADEDKE